MRGALHWAWKPCFVLSVAVSLCDTDAGSRIAPGLHIAFKLHGNENGEISSTRANLATGEGRRGPQCENRNRDLQSRLGRWRFPRKVNCWKLLS